VNAQRAAYQHTPISLCATSKLKWWSDFSADLRVSSESITNNAKSTVVCARALTLIAHQVQSAAAVNNVRLFLFCLAVLERQIDNFALLEYEIWQFASAEFESLFVWWRVPVRLFVCRLAWSVQRAWQNDQFRASLFYNLA
jgi:hypothetical protein